MKLSIVIPCFNEIAGLEALLQEVAETARSVSEEFEIIPVDDGSSDGTEMLLRHLSGNDQAIKPIFLSRNFGKESAMYAGLQASTGDGVVIMDGDGQHPPKLIPALLQQRDLGYLQVVAKRDRSGDPFFRKLLSKLYYKITSKFSESSLVDGEGDYRYMDRVVVGALLSISERNRFSKGLYEWVGFSKTVVSYSNELRSTGKSSWKLSSLIDYGIEGLISFNTKPLRIIMWIGLGISMASFVYVGYMAYIFIADGVSAPGYLTTIGAIGILGGTQLVSIAILGEYVGKTYIEAKRRPIYLEK